MNSIQENISVKVDISSIFYKETVILRNVSFDISSGNLVAFMGKNGSGKSSLLRILSGETENYRGDVMINNQDIKSFNRKELSTQIAIVSTGRIISDYIKVIDYVTLGRAPYTGLMGRLSNNDKQVVKSVLSKLQISHLSDKVLSQISDGERKKADIARALAQETPIILLDEPTAFLDIPSKYNLVYLLHQIAEEFGKIIIFSTHDIEPSVSVSHKILYIKDTDTVIYHNSNNESIIRELNSLKQVNEAIISQQ